MSDVNALEPPELIIKFGENEIAFSSDQSCDNNPLCIPWMGQYIAAVYRYSVGIAAVLAVVMIMVGGFTWLVSGGSPDKIGRAKEFIVSALIGLALALFSYVILYTINPRLVGVTAVSVEAVAEEEAWAAREKIVDSCQHEDAYHFVVKDLVLPSSCSDYNFRRDPNLMAIAAAESSCNPDAQSSAGACGLMQLLPSTASKLAGRQVTCQELKDDPDLSIELASRYINKNVSVHKNNIYHIAAGYNSGFGTQPTSSGRPALARSVDCPGCYAYECATNPGGLVETQRYVEKVISYGNAANEVISGY